MSDPSKIISAFGLFKQLVEDTAKDIYEEEGFLNDIIVLLNKDQEAMFAHIDSNFKELEEEIIAFAIVKNVKVKGKELISIVIMDNETKYGRNYEKHNEKLEETNEKVNFKEAEKHKYILEKKVDAEKE